MTPFELEPAGDISRVTDDEEYESEETTMHPFERRSSLVRMQLSSYAPSHSSSSFTPRLTMRDEDPMNMIERLQIEIETLRRQAADAIQVSVRLADQLSEAQAETSRVRTQMKRTETMLNEESRRRRETERAADEEARLRWALEDEVRRLQGRPARPTSTPST
jgi:septal ring factor EnvC (AmiA/AmiB activator)